jgi:arylsulfatase A-like enzyme
VVALNAAGQHGIANRFAASLSKQNPWNRSFKHDMNAGSAAACMKLRLYISLFFLAIGPVLQSAPPNIVIVMSDDMGFSDIGCYGGEIKTPHLDALAKNGIRFTQFYNTARCCPTRAALLTGLYPHQAGVGHMMADRAHDGYRGDLNRNCVTIPEALKSAGYRNYAVGKWHITRHIQPEGPKHSWPLQRGFDRYYGTIHGGGSYFDPSTLTRDNTPISPFADAEYKPATFYYTDAISDHAIRFVSQHKKNHAAKPFFLYVAYTAAHWPMHALPEDIARYRGKYDSGYEPARGNRLKNLKMLGLLDERWQPAPLIGNWAEVNDKHWEAAGMEVYAAMVDRMDQGIGRLIDQLRKNDQLENTFFCYLQDNGGCAEPMGRTGNTNHPAVPRAEKPSLAPMALDALLPPGSVPPQTRDGFPVLMGKKVLPGPGDTYIAYGEAWANVSNTPFREYKHWVHEGGISTPFIVHWPAGIPANRRNSFEAQPAHVIDLMATCLDLAQAKYPEVFGGFPIKPLRGVSLRSAIEGRKLTRTEPLFWEHEGNRAVRNGKWKLVAKENKPWELYDMELDRTERNNLADQQAEILRDLAAKWDAYAQRSDVLPLGTWREQPARTTRR